MYFNVIIVPVINVDRKKTNELEKGLGQQHPNNMVLLSIKNLRLKYVIMNKIANEASSYLSQLHR